MLQFIENITNIRTGASFDSHKSTYYVFTVRCVNVYQTTDLSAPIG